MWKLVAIARDAGAEILRFREGQPLLVEHKADLSPLTEADRAAHRTITTALAAWDASVPMISEEGEIADYDVRRQWTRFWLVDPLDGTQEFVAGRDEFTVNIALIDAGVPILGVVHAPALDVTYVAASGRGARKQSGTASPERIYARPPVTGAPAVVVESRSHPSPELEAYLARRPVARRVRVGSSIKFCWLAEGLADLYPRFGTTMEWDVAAGDCIFRHSSPSAEPYASPLRYNKPDLRNGPFVMGFEPVPAGVLWFTGLSGSGKSTVAERVTERLAERNVRVEYLDGDEIRRLFPATGFTRPERDAHIKRVGYLASRLEHHGITVVASLVSPYAESRAFVRALCRNFIEIYVATPLAECERRDPKGLYAKARRGEIAHFTGIDDPYEPPVDPELILDTEVSSIEEAVDRVIERLVGVKQPVAREV